MMAARPALFLDRDGVINVDYAYVHRKEDFHFVDGIFDLCREAKRLGYRIFVITNQAGIGRGYYTEQDFHDLTAWMQARLREEGVEADAVYFSPYHPEHGIGAYKKESECRKPGPGMLHQAAAEFEIDFARSVLVGDKYSDVQAGVAAGVGRNLLFVQDGGGDADKLPGVSAALSGLREAIAHLHAAARPNAPAQ
jgi:D-glycero-D-manno-heptose 1,7-bisphosphate phosphatase